LYRLFSPKVSPPIYVCDFAIQSVFFIFKASRIPDVAVGRINFYCQGFCVSE